MVPRLGVEPRELFLLREATLPDLSSGAFDWRRAEESNPIPLSENRVFKARRRTIPPALLSINLVPQAGLEPATHEFSVRCSTIGATEAY